MTISALTPLQLIAGKNLLQNQGISESPTFLTAVSSYENLPLIAPLLNTITIGGTPNIANVTILTANTIANLEVLGNSSCPALGDSVPSSYTSSITIQINPPGFSGALLTEGAKDSGNGSISKFVQILNQAQGYASITNTFIDSAVNGHTYLANTFSNMNNMVTGDITNVNLATQAFAKDLSMLGTLIELDNLDNLGSPLALIQSIVATTGSIPAVALGFISFGVPQEVVINFNDPALSITDSVQKLMYNAMTQVTGSALAQILQVLNVTTPNINTMADLLNPYKLFPNSYQSLTVQTANGAEPIYVNNVGTVNTKLVKELPSYVVSSIV